MMPEGFKIYWLVPLMALLLVSAQATWGSAIKNDRLLEGSPTAIIANLMTSPRMWLGGLIYIVATVLYFLLLSKAKFFSVQVSMTAVSILFSTLMAAVLFHEEISALNVLGAILVMAGLACVLAR